MSAGRLGKVGSASDATEIIYVMDGRNYMKTATGKHYNIIDAMKLVMAFFIVMGHTNPLTDVSPEADYFVVQYMIRVAVPFFFVAAGFFLFGKFPDRQISMAVIGRYIKRIFRMFFAWICIYLPLVLWYYRNTYSDWEGCLALVWTFFFVDMGFHLWFLIALIWAVLFLAILFRYKVKMRTIFFITLLCYIPALLGHAYYGLFLYICPEGSYTYECVRVLQHIFITPRNGICYAAVYMFMGAYVAFHNYDIARCRLVLLTALSWLLFLGEVIFVKELNWLLNGDAYVMLLPVTFFTFLLARQIEVRDLPVYRHLRQMSILVYLIHPVFLVIFRLLSEGGIYQASHLMLCGLTMLISCLSAEVIMYLSGKRYGEIFKLLS